VGLAFSLADDTTMFQMPVSMPRIAPVESWFHDMDAGWTRFIFDAYDIPFKVICPGNFKNIDFLRHYDVVVYPENKRIC